MFYEFLQKNKIEILELTEEKNLALAGPLKSSQTLREGLPIFFDNLIEFLKSPKTEISEKKILFGAASHGTELLRLNYTLSHVVHAYGSICQAITEFAKRKKFVISAQEFNDLNLCLDIAIASAVTEFQFRSVQDSDEREIQHIGFLVHELRNALSSATVAHDMITQGIVGTSGNTARVLANNLVLMRNLIDRSLSDVRMRADPEVHINKFVLNVLVDQILLTAQSEARSKKQILENQIVVEFKMETDRQLLLSAIANLIQNALKYTKIEGRIAIRAKASGANVVIEVENECDGIDSITIENIFKPFVSGGFDQGGLGLGLTIVQRAVFLLQGKLSVYNSPGYGCAFLIDIPLKIARISPVRTISAEKSAQPKSSKND